MATMMQKTCMPCLTARPSAVPFAVRPRVARAATTVRVQAVQEQVSAEVVRAVGVLSAASTLLVAGNASAAVELSQLAEADNRIFIIASLFVPVIGWVGFNILFPLLSQLTRMGEMNPDGTPKPAKAGTKKTGTKSVFARSTAAAVGLSAAAMLLAESASASALEVAQLAETDNRIFIIATLFVPVVGWVGFNILLPLLNQVDRMDGKNEKEGTKPGTKKAGTKSVGTKAVAAVKKVASKPVEKGGVAGLFNFGPKK